MIDPKSLTLADIGKEVVFQGKKRGRIFSFSATAIQVIYPPRPYATLTRPEDLTFL